MLTLYVEEHEFFDDRTRQFIDVPAMKLDFEHSLASLSKWEEIWETPFLGDKEKSNEQVRSYVRCMLLTENVPDIVLYQLTQEQQVQINDYIGAKHTATTFHNLPHQRATGETVTAEVIEYWMVTLNIWYEARYWHLNRLLTLVKVVNLKNTPPKKMSRAEAAARQRQLNAQRRAKYGTTG